MNPDNRVGRILVVDDEEGIRTFLAEALERSGLRGHSGQCRRVRQHDARGNSLSDISDCERDRISEVGGLGGSAKHLLVRPRLRSKTHPPVRCPSPGEIRARRAA
jgi:DNA-binding response OmpR family regulator